MAVFFSRRFTQLILSVFLGFAILPKHASAQRPRYLKLQPHKLMYADTVYREAIAKNDSLLLAEAYYLYGKTYEASGDNLTSQRWFLKSLRILEPRGDSFDLSRLYNRLSSSQENYGEMLRYAMLAMAVARRIHSDKALMRVYGNMAQIHRTDWSESGKKPNLPRPRPDSTLFYFREIYRLAYQLKDPVAMISINSSLGHFTWDTDRNPKAIQYLKTALDLAAREKEDGARINLLLEIASIYTTLKQPEQTWRYLRQAQQLLNENPFNDYNVNTAFEREYMAYYRLIGDWKRAYERSEKLRGMENSSYMADRAGAIVRLNMEYKSEKREALLKTQKQELALRAETLVVQQRFTWAASALLLVTAAMSLIFFRLYRKNRRISQRNVELVKEQNHRVKNNLQVVSSLLNLQATQLADETARKAVEESQLRVRAMAILHRRLYDEDTLVVVDVAPFISELVESVLQTFGYASVEPAYDLVRLELSADDALPLGLIINELTTNACKYAFPDHPNPIFRISSEWKGNRYRIFVVDNGPGLPASLDTVASTEQQGGFGMRLIQMQVDQLDGEYRFRSEGGTQFVMEFKV
ncbi:hypothetical protein GCM10028803_11630 [Larkinella knui]|nr:sensor histidine kinase [Larkinella knui]